MEDFLKNSFYAAMIIWDIFLGEVIIFCVFSGGGWEILAFLVFLILLGSLYAEYEYVKADQKK